MICMLSSLKKFKYNTNYIDFYKHIQRSHCNILYTHTQMYLKTVIYEKGM